MAFTLPPLPYDYSALEPHIDTQTMQIHHDKHHAAYVNGANAALEQLSGLRGGADLDRFNQLADDLAFNVSGHVLHSIFWTNLSPDGGDRPDGDLGAAIDEHFGTFDAFKAQLTTATQGVQGSGWGVLAWEPLGKRLIITQVYDHHGNVGIGSVPILVFDAWEHAYYLQYKNVRPDYVGKLWSLVNWEDVAARFAAAKG